MTPGPAPDPIVAFCGGLGGVATLDPRGHVTWVSDRFAAQLGRDPAALLSAPCSLFSGEAMPLLTVAGRLASGHMWHGEVATDGGVYQCTALPYPTPGAGMLVCLAPPAGGATATAAFARLVRGALHELKTPLAGAFLALDLVDMKLGAASTVRDVVAQGRERLHRCLAIMNEVGHYAQLRTPDLQPLDVAALLRDFLRPGHVPKAWGSVTLQTPQDAPCPVVGDAGMLRELFLRLLDNAAEATSGRGAIAVGLEPQEQSFSITIDDQGPGLERHKLPHLGQAFASTKPGKLGLGLALAQRLAALHGGTVDLVDLPGGPGCRAMLRLPRAPDD